MPYIRSATLRKFFNSSIYRITDKANGPGEMVYVMYKLLKVWAEMRGGRFFTYCFVMGICVCTMLEFYRRIIVPYEDKKIEENGDVE